MAARLGTLSPSLMLLEHRRSPGLIFGRIYFPTYSNGLKEIGAFIGAKWQAPGASGLQSLIWRYRWEETRSEEFKHLLLTYNQDDCRALSLLTSELKQIIKLATSRADVDFAYAPKKNATESGLEIHDAFLRNSGLSLA